ncbi:DUF4145 domain-containing protein [Phormidium sp. CLA17]|uniref:DUF4145 domain-containing protein n=1 Tax=Leptolyngbya sp. Cla-17 TaxID=2803751 RepID=UPI0014932632|nr:DUF4145 domain-containing protein [Leptolyngbya sp. Cla-17]MBM0743346.1 DUF4145 domain-containing protein [Leptolyngbya sp. Cla-17]
MTNTKQKTTGFLTCNHCGNHAPMNIVAEYYRSLKPAYGSPEGDYYNDYEPDQGYRYELLLCLACKEVTLWKYFDADYVDPEEITTETLYPLAKSRLSGLPYRIQDAYEISLKVRVIDANAYAVLLGRILEMVCEDRKATGKDLFHQLKDLATKGEIPVKLVGVADNLRHLRNIGAHASLGELTKDEIPILDDLCRAILEYVYRAPYLAEKAQQRLNRLKEKRVKKEETNGEDSEDTR